MAKIPFHLMGLYSTFYTPSKHRVSGSVGVNHRMGAGKRTAVPNRKKKEKNRRRNYMARLSRRRNRT